MYLPRFSFLKYTFELQVVWNSHHEKRKGERGFYIDDDYFKLTGVLYFFGLGTVFCKRFIVYSSHLDTRRTCLLKPSKCIGHLSALTVHHGLEVCHLTV